MGNYSLGSNVCDLARQAEVHSYMAIQKINDETNTLLEKMENIHRFIAAAQTQSSAGTSKEAKFSISDNPELMQIADQIRSYDPYLIAEFTTSWEGKTLSALLDNLQEYSREQMSKISQQDIQLKQEFQKMNQIFDILQEMLKSEREHIRSITNRTGR